MTKEKEYKILWSICHQITLTIYNETRCNSCPLNCVVPCRKLNSFEHRNFDFFKIAQKYILENLSKMYNGDPVLSSQFFPVDWVQDDRNMSSFRDKECVNWAVKYLAEMFCAVK